MKIYGYQSHSDALLQLEETTFQCNLNELSNLIDFLLHVHKEHSAVADKTDMCHTHLRDWDTTWEKGSPDIIVVTTWGTNSNGLR
ncbi:MAG: hypothetical protein LBN26_04160 [Christensenellaceae bacterium]|nr:hypothetical protein [Christensenellaceae bacterium]